MGKFHLTLVFILIPLMALSTSGHFTSDYQSQGIDLPITSNELITNTTVWDGLEGEIIINGSLEIGSGGLFQIQNSNVTITNIYPIEGDLKSIFIVKGNGKLEVHNSTIYLNTTSHGIFGINPLSGGYIDITDSRLWGSDNDIINLSGGYDIRMHDSIIEESGGNGVVLSDMTKDLNFTNSIFRNNFQEGLDIVIDGPVQVSFYNLTIENNDNGLQIENNDGQGSLVNLTRVSSINNRDKGIELVIRDGVIEVEDSLISGNVGDGFQFEFANEIYVDRTEFSSNGVSDGGNSHGAQIDVIDQAYITNSIFRDNTGDGLNIAFTNLTISNSEILNNNDEGIDYDGNSVFRTISLNNLTIDGAKDGDGIKINQHTGSVEVYNSSISGGDDGLQIELGNTSLIVDNLVSSNNRENGLELDNVYKMRLTNSRFDNNDIAGVEVVNGTDIMIMNVTALDNGEFGMNLQNTQNVSISNITLNDNSGISSGAHGLILQNSDFDLSESEFSSNSGSGLIVLDSSGLITSIISSGNSQNGIEAQNSILQFHEVVSSGNIFEGLSAGNSEIQIIGSSFVNNNDSGLLLVTSSVNITSVGIENNVEDGLRVTNTDLSLTFSNVSQNGANGISLLGTTDARVLNNTIGGNGVDGVFISNQTNAVINFNQFVGNRQYGIHAASRSNTSDLVDARYNYFGSDEGPIYEDVGKAGRDGISGPVNVSLILTSEGEIVGYVPPDPPELPVDGFTTRQIIIGVLLLVFSGLVIFSVIYAYYIDKWQKEAQPRSVIVISPSGLPIAEFHAKTIKSDSALVSGFLSAVSSFGSEVVESKSSSSGLRIREISYEHFTILLHKVNMATLAIVVEQSNRRIKQKVHDLGEDLKKSYPELKPDQQMMMSVPELHGFIEKVRFHLSEFLKYNEVN